MRYLIVAAVLALFGCAAKVQAGNENSVIVGPARDASEAFQIAQQHCGQYGRTARLNGLVGPGLRYGFDCV